MNDMETDVDSPVIEQEDYNVTTPDGSDNTFSKKTEMVMGLIDELGWKLFTSEGESEDDTRLESLESGYFVLSNLPLSVEVTPSGAIRYKIIYDYGSWEEEDFDMLKMQQAIQKRSFASHSIDSSDNDCIFFAQVLPKLPEDMLPTVLKAFLLSAESNYNRFRDMRSEYIKWCVE